MVTVLAFLCTLWCSPCSVFGTAQDAWAAEKPKNRTQQSQKIVRALDVSWGPDETRQLQPVEIAAAVAERSCGPDCRQVTFLPGWSGEEAENRCNVSGNLLVTNVLLEGSRVVVYVDLSARKAYALGAIAPSLGAANAGCSSAVVDSGCIAYACWANRAADGFTAELRIFTPSTRVERRVWQQPAGAPAGNPSCPGFLKDNVVMTNSSKCERSCNALFLLPLPGGPAKKVFPPPGKEGGIGEGHASHPYIVWTDISHFLPHVEVAFLDISGNAPAAPVSTAGVGDRYGARIKGSRVAWMDTRNDPQQGYWHRRNLDIYAKDLATGEEWAVCTNAAMQESPDVEGDIVVWTDYRNNDNPYPYPSKFATHSDVYAANVRTRKEWRLTKLPGLASDVRIDGGRVFFRWMTDDKPPQIYMIDLKARGIVP